jgi:hypothetical protein
MNLARFLLLPWWIAQLPTGAKAFCDNPVIGSPTLNRWGLHVARARIAASMAAGRRKRLARMVSEADRAAFEKDGFVLHHDFLPAELFAALRDEAFAYRAAARETVQGDTITRRIALGPRALSAMPAARALLARRDWRGLLCYAWSYDAEPLFYIQSILTHAAPGAADPQTALHADTFHPTVKSWLFLTDVGQADGPFVYVPGSHRKTPVRLAWEKARSIRARDGLDRLSSRGSLRIGAEELTGLGLPPPLSFAVPANTLIVADTSGFHARGAATRPSIRVEIWAYGRRNPFLPWTGLEPTSIPWVKERRMEWAWTLRDRLAGLIGQPWRGVGMKSPLDPA